MNPEKKYKGKYVGKWHNEARMIITLPKGVLFGLEEYCTMSGLSYNKSIQILLQYAIGGLRAEGTLKRTW